MSPVKQGLYSLNNGENMLVNLFKLIFIGFFVYLIYSLVRFIFFVKKNVNEAQKRMDNQKRNSVNRPGAGGRDKDVIELDKDEYHVD